MWFVIEKHKLPNHLLEAEGGEGEILWAVFEYIQPQYLILHSLMSFALQQFSLDFVQLQFKAYASKLAFLGQETFSAKIASLGVVLACNHLGFVLYTGHPGCTEKPRYLRELHSTPIHWHSPQSFSELSLSTPSSSRHKISLYVLIINSGDKSLQGISKII